MSGRGRNGQFTFRPAAGEKGGIPPRTLPVGQQTRADVSKSEVPSHRESLETKFAYCTRHHSPRHSTTSRRCNCKPRDYEPARHKYQGAPSFRRLHIQPVQQQASRAYESGSTIPLGVCPPDVWLSWPIRTWRTCACWAQHKKQRGASPRQPL